mgnify:CR=1 FL=1
MTGKKRTAPRRKAKAVWERGYQGHVYWLGREKLGKVSLLAGRAADPLLFALAPIIAATAAFAAFAVVPFGAATTFFGLLDEPMPLQVADVNVAVLVIFAVASMRSTVVAACAGRSRAASGMPGKPPPEPRSASLPPRGRSCSTRGTATSAS